jgi:mono/diheme cytochrome c family protein
VSGVSPRADPPRRGRVVAAAAVALGLLALVVWSLRPDARDGSSATAVQVALGERIYATHCLACHRPDGAGAPEWRTRNPDGTLPPPPHDAGGHTWHHADGLLYRIVRDGGAASYGDALPSAMPAFGEVLEPTEIAAVLEYLKTLWTPEQRAFQERLSDADPYPPEAVVAGADTR